MYLQNVAIKGGCQDIVVWLLRCSCGKLVVVKVTKMLWGGCQGVLSIATECGY